MNPSSNAPKTRERRYISLDSESPLAKSAPGSSSSTSRTSSHIHPHPWNLVEPCKIGWSALSHTRSRPETYIHRHPPQHSAAACTSWLPRMSASSTPCRRHCRSEHRARAGASRPSSQTCNRRAGSTRRCCSPVSTTQQVGTSMVPKLTNQRCSRQTAASHPQAKGPCR